MFQLIFRRAKISIFLARNNVFLSFAITSSSLRNKEKPKKAKRESVNDQKTVFAHIDKKKLSKLEMIKKVKTWKCQPFQMQKEKGKKLVAAKKYHQIIKTAFIKFHVPKNHW